MSKADVCLRRHLLISCFTSSRACVTTQPLVSEAESLRGAVDRRQSREEDRHPEEHISTEMERHVHRAGDADVDPAVPRLRPFELSQRLADGRADGALVADPPALQRPVRES